ncbi:MAG TPA: hypothetical protein VFC78_17245 [Tepidisphaeraceae bacterium]|nr:hypothetical protein [Tepidisphaeraceae bacterium]
MSNAQIYWYVADAVKALLTPVLAVFGIFIARRQAQTGRQKLNLELFDRRFRVYQAAKAFLNDLSIDAGAGVKFFEMFRVETAEAAFIFPPKITGFLNELRNQASELKENTNHLDMLTQARDTSKAIAEATEMDEQLLTWVNLKTDELVDIFRPHLNLRYVK